MAQAHYKDSDTGDDKEVTTIMNDKQNENTNCGSFKFNAAAPEFVPRIHVPAQTQATQTPVPVPLTDYYYPCFQYVDGTSGSWIYVADQETAIQLVQPKPNSKSGSAQNQNNNSKETIVLSDELRLKINKQAEYMFSDMSMLANESFAKHVLKDPEGYVPINFVTTTKKLKSLSVTNQMVAQALKSSSKLVVSPDGKKVRRKNPFNEKEKEELQMRTIIAENLPDDHSHQNIEKLFNVVGNIKAIRICQPQEPSSSRSSKGDLVVSNKLHALIEYENSETAERAAEKLNDERNWRKGMRVRVMLKRLANVQPKTGLNRRKASFDGCVIDNEGVAHQLTDDSWLNSSEPEEGDENSGASKKSWCKNRVKPKTRPQLQSTRSLPSPSSYSSGSCPGEILGRQTTKGPRMPDGTRGFTMGRGKALTVPIQSS